MNLRDLAERCVWTFVSAAIGAAAIGSALSLDLAVWQSAALAGGAAVANVVLAYARQRLAVLPNPGDGLPGLPT
jgi:hypothetical protein